MCFLKETSKCVNIIKTQIRRFYLYKVPSQNWVKVPFLGYSLWLTVVLLLKALLSLQFLELPTPAAQHPWSLDLTYLTYKKGVIFVVHVILLDFVAFATSPFIV